MTYRRIGAADLAAQHLALADDIEREVLRVLRSGNYILGAEVAAFESELARLFGARHVIACGSGTDALTLSLLALGVGPGDEVVVPAFTIFAGAEVVSLLGATPVFCDVDLVTCAIDPARVRITPRTKAIMPAHLYGVPADVDALRELGVPVIEDAAQAIGATLRGRGAGTLGDFGCFSFFPTKNLGAAGDGGAIATDDPARADQLRRLRVHGATAKYRHEAIGLNSRLDELQAAILRVKLRHLPAAQTRRAAIAARYDAALGALAAPKLRAGFVTNHHLYTIRHPRRDALRAHLATHGIDAAIHYPLAAFQQPVYRAHHADADFPVATQLAATVLSLPSHPQLTDADVDRVVEAVRSF